MLNEIKSCFSGKKTLILFLFMMFYIYPQTWNNTVTTTINEPNLEKMDLFTNKDGNHLLIKRSNGNIVYYNLNSLGTVVISNTVLESSGDFPTITGSNERVYAFYRAGSYLKMKYSTDGGDSWIYDPDLDKYIGANECNGIDAIYEIGQGVHIVWATMDSGYDFETYYYRLTPWHIWTDGKTVTDYTQYEVGGAPTVVFSENRIHVSYNNKGGIQLSGAMKTRDRYNGVWQTPQFISTTDESMAERLVVRGSYLYAVYEKYISGYLTHVDLAYKSRHLSGIWSSGAGTVIDYAILEDPTSFNVCRTYNDKLQLVYVDVTGGGDNFFHRSYNGSWSDPPFTLDGNQNFDLVPKGLSNTSNDVFVTWKRNGDNYIRYRQYDDYPLAPQGLSVGPYYQGNKIFAKLTWALNNEPDVFIKQSAFEIKRRIRFLDGPWGSWSIVGYKNGNQTEFIDYEVQGADVADVYTAEYKIRARDYNNHYSPYSSTVSISFQKYVPNSPAGGGLNSANKTTETNGIGLSYNYNLGQNYPNPFNPSTEIKYTLAKDSYVTVKVYDMLGTEVTALVSEPQTAGNYEVNFNANNLSSGVYIYRITASKNGGVIYTDAKQMILMK